MKKALALVATAALALSFTSVAGASMAPVTTSKAPTVVSFKVTPNHLPDTGGVVTLDCQGQARDYLYLCRRRHADPPLCQRRG